MAWCLQGKALGTEFGLAETYPKASVGYAVAAVPSGADPAPITAKSRRSFRATRTRACLRHWSRPRGRAKLRAREFQQNSIPDLASTWSQALAAEGRDSPMQIVEAMKKVTVEDVNRVAKNYLLVPNAIVATLKPSASGAAGLRQGLRRSRGDHGGANQARHPARLGGSLGEVAESAAKHRPPRRI